jgi:hypothetical protein
MGRRGGRCGLYDPVMRKSTSLMRIAVIAGALALSTVGTPVAPSSSGAVQARGLKPAVSQEVEPSERVTCVKARSVGAYAVEGSVKAVRAWLRPKTMTNQGGTYRLTPGNYAIRRIGPASLGTGEGPEERRLARHTQRQCGTQMAEHTWLTIVDFPRSTLAAGSLALLTARTSDGWRVVYEGRARG